VSGVSVHRWFCFEIEDITGHIFVAAVSVAVECGAVVEVAFKVFAIFILHGLPSRKCEQCLYADGFISK